MESITNSVALPNRTRRILLRTAIESIAELAKDDTIGSFTNFKLEVCIEQLSMIYDEFDKEDR